VLWVAPSAIDGFLDDPSSCPKNSIFLKVAPTHRQMIATRGELGNKGLPPICRPLPPICRPLPPLAASCRLLGLGIGVVGGVWGVWGSGSVAASIPRASLLIHSHCCYPSWKEKWVRLILQLLNCSFFVISMVSSVICLWPCAMMMRQTEIETCLDLSNSQTLSGCLFVLFKCLGCGGQAFFYLELNWVFCVSFLCPVPLFSHVLPRCRLGL